VAFVSLVFANLPAAAAPNRILTTVDPAQTKVIAGNVHRLAQSRFDRGAVDPAMSMNRVLILYKPSAAQQTDLDQLLQDLQNPSSPQFHRWLTPEQFGDRFGLSPSDHSKVVAWLASQGLKIEQSGRSRNWVAFSGTAERVSKALRTTFRRLDVNGESHFANMTDPEVPAALADVVGGFMGLDDFKPRPLFIQAPQFNSGSNHFLSPEDFATIYDITPLYTAGINGTGQSIVVVGQSDISTTDIRNFRSQFKLSTTNLPHPFLFGPDPGGLGSGSNVEANLDLEWSGAVAPNATINFVYSTSAFQSLIFAIDLNISPIITVSYGSCEIDFSPGYRPLLQQGNAQGITIMVASGDSGAAGCDAQGSQPLATLGEWATFPSAMPEVTSVGGTMFLDTPASTYWATTNDAASGSALSYIPEAAWNESSTANGLGASGGGVSQFFERPTWQTGPGVPNDNFRHVPDIAFSAAVHDSYLIITGGNLGGVGGTSASSPSFAGIVALLEQSLAPPGQTTQMALGNINPQLYRLAQAAPSVFHDITTGSNVVPCSELSPSCTSGSYGYQAGAGYDMATGLGSLDVNAFVTQWSTATNAVTVKLTSSAVTGTINSTVTLTATVAAATGSATPTGTVSFVAGTNALGTATLSSGTATFTLPLGSLATSGLVTYTLAANYSGDASFSAGGATTTIKVTAPQGGAAVVLTGPTIVWPGFPDAQGPTWIANLTLAEFGGVPALVTGFTMDGSPLTLAQYFPSNALPANGSLAVAVTLRGVSAPVTHTFGVSGTDAAGNTWSRQLSIPFYPQQVGTNFTLAATPLVIAQNPSAPASCQWSTQVNLDDQGGTLNVISSFTEGGGIAPGISLSPASILGTKRVGAWAGLQGTVCFSNVTPGGVSNVETFYSNGDGEQVTVSFTGPLANPTTITATPATLSLSTAGTAQSVTGTLNVDPGAGQSWSAVVYPTNRTTSWLTLSQTSGTGSAQVTLTANRGQFESGAYRATIVIQSPNAMPRNVNVPVMFVIGGGASAPNVAAVVNAASSQPGVSPGGLVTVYGTNLAGGVTASTGSPLPYTLGGVTATVNGVAAPLLYVSPTQINLQVPYAAGAGAGTVGVTYNGQGGGAQVQVLPANPGIFVDGSNNLAGNPNSSVAPGGFATMFVTGIGEISVSLSTAFAPSASTPLASLPRPLLPVTVTVGGVEAFISFIGITPGLIGTAQINIEIPPGVPTGVQPVIVTVNGVASAAGNLTITSQ